MYVALACRALGKSRNCPPLGAGAFLGPRVPGPHSALADEIFYFDVNTFWIVFSMSTNSISQTKHGPSAAFSAKKSSRSSRCYSQCVGHIFRCAAKVMFGAAGDSAQVGGTLGDDAG